MASGLALSWELIKHFPGIVLQCPHNNLGVGEMSPFWDPSPTPGDTQHV